MVIKDRGNIKWTSLMLVEHKRKLKQYKKVQYQKEKPDIDEQYLQKMNYQLGKALAENLQIKLVYFNKGKYNTLQGYVKKNTRNSKLLTVISEDRNLNIKLKNIIDLELLG